eukprot:3932599-Rhodomonas_salina.1
MSDTSSFAKIEKVDGPVGGQFEVACFDAAYLQENHQIDANDSVWMEIQRRDKLFSLVLKHASKHGKGDLTSFTPKPETKEQSLVDRIVGLGSATKCVSLVFGLGVAEIEHIVDGKSYTLYAVHQRRGPVVGTNCGPAMWQTLVVLCKGKQNKQALTSFAEQLLKEDEEADDNEFHIFRWDVQDSYWDMTGSKVARSLDSVVLPAETKNKVVTDLDDFLTRDTYAWYTEHGIPYKRSYLFYGVPGGGKTSLLQALAGKYRRNLCILQPTDPRFTDDKLADAIKEAPSRSIIVLEDVDALFDKARGSCNAKIQITFSGLLNALDGICNPDGQIFILTTNFREHLDAALIRNGRVDLHIEFTHAQPEQMRQLFLQFYPNASAELAVKFRDALVATLQERKVSMAALQHYFIGNRRSTPEEAAGGVQRIIEDMDEKAVEAAKSREAKGEASKEPAQQQSDKEARKKERKKESAGRASALHVHIHTGAAGGQEEEEEDEERR